jgi:hypothetical protein
LPYELNEEEEEDLTDEYDGIDVEKFGWDRAEEDVELHVQARIINEELQTIKVKMDDPEDDNWAQLPEIFTNLHEYTK